MLALSSIGGYQKLMDIKIISCRAERVECSHGKEADEGIHGSKSEYFFILLAGNVALLWAGTERDIIAISST